MADFELLEKTSADAEWLQTAADLLQDTIVAHVRSATNNANVKGMSGQARVSAEALAAQQNLFQHIARPVIAKTVRGEAKDYLTLVKGGISAHNPTVGSVDFDPSSPVLNKTTEQAGEVQPTDEQRKFAKDKLIELIHFYGVARANENTARHPNNPDDVFRRIERLLDAIA